MGDGQGYVGVLVAEECEQEGEGVAELSIRLDSGLF